jgi:predicted lipoprotein with Yx(FWY)xxD motif
MHARVVVALGCLTLLAGCGGEDPGASPTAGPSSSPTSAAPSTPTPSLPTTKPPKRVTQSRDGTELVVEGSDFGPMLFDASGQAIYLFDVETTSEPRCYGDCAEAWPPVYADGSPVAGDGVRAALLGTVKRTDGRRQVTYGGHPLYFYAHEGKHEVLCHDVFLNGGTWYVVQPDGDAAPPG